MHNNLLMIASTVSPRWGSEGAVGWNWLAHVPTGWSTTLITSKECAEEVRNGAAAGHLAPSLKEIKSPKRSWTFRPKNLLLTRINEWIKFRHNLRSFQAEASKLCRQQNFDLVHQTTIASWVFGMPSHRLGKATVWGPIGGGEPFPWRYASQTSVANWIFEGCREVSGMISRLRRSVVSAVRNVDVIIVTNRQTELLLRRIGRTKTIVRQPMVISEEKFNSIRKASRPKTDQRLKIMSSGSIEGRKGVALTIHALKELKRQGIDFEFTVTGHGMELGKLRRLARMSGLGTEVRFETNLDTNEYVARLAESHVFCFPSLRDNSPVSLLEAMAAGCVPVVLDNGGPAEAVDDECGFVLPIETPSGTIRRISDVLANLWSNRPLRESLSAGSQQKVAASYVDSKLTSLIDEVYHTAVKNHLRESNRCEN